MATRFDPIRDLDRFFSEVTRTPNATSLPMDLYRDGEVFIARIDMPGVDPASIDVDVEDRTLTVRAQRESEVAEKDVKWLTRERTVGTYARQLTLGNRVALDRISADYVDGVLTLTIPVAEEARPRKINVSHSSPVRATEVVESTSTEDENSAQA
ncbi:MAG: Hsp20/alpha crystallin family protein [Brevibacterium sp.]|uniref:Hsp20/alpha crystallin family protein n=1 Tax=unclassified Brevibacterium TaxID=2614124 RepID=UPI001E58AA6A|nr:MULTISPECIES: Hsp20/alpha crystallin family protein [unclassified Brevibacterium]MCD1284830.1 heat-shock protein Hsp20 [Brevibacterium sp. CCUG 69071]MDK8435549.1 Hsp20/alpha crystallin family protein [Brevibacterium sp. H-BE7]